MAIRLVGTNAITGTEVEAVVNGPLIYDGQGNLTVDPSTLATGDKACPSAGCPAMILTQDPEVV